MSSRVIKLLISVCGFMLAGYLTSSLIKPAEQPVTVTPTPVDKPDVTDKDEDEPIQGVIIDESGGITENDEDYGDDDPFGDVDEDSAWDSEDNALIGERNPDAYMPSTKEEPLPEIQEEPEAGLAIEPAEKIDPPVKSASQIRSLERTGERLAKQYEKEDKKAEKRDKPGYRSEDYTPDQWKQPDKIYEELSAKVLAALGKKDKESIQKFLSDPAGRLDLARLTMIRKAGASNIKLVAAQRMGTAMLFNLTSDLDWMTGLMYSGPTDKLERGLSNLAAIYAAFSEDMSDPVNRRIATTAAVEFAREGWSQKDMLERYAYYAKSYKEGKLNIIFENLDYWDTRLVTGCDHRGGWGSVRSLTWQRDNVRLPDYGYLSACNQLIYRLRNVAGDSVFSSDYLAPILKHTNNTTAWAHREIGGVCGACSHYGAYGALASGIPAMTMGEPGHCAYAVRVGNDWRMSYSIYWQHGMHKTFWGLHDWDFLILMQRLYSDKYKTLASDQLLALAEFLASKRQVVSAFDLYDYAIAAQPLNWPAWVSYAGYTRQKTPKSRERWMLINEVLTDTMAAEFHNAAATMLVRYVYPNLLPLVPEKRARNKMYEAFFKQCATYGTNRWDIAPLLNAQIQGCTSSKEKLAYMKDSLQELMKKADYCGSVLAWGLDYIASLPSADEESLKLQEDFTDIIIKAMSKAKTTRKQIDETWRALGEAIFAAAENGDKRTFQAVGKLAHRKCRKKFPRNRLRFKKFPGKVVSSEGMIQTATTLDPSQVPHACLHWAVLQRGGGNIPAKFEGTAGMVVELDNTCQVNGVVALFGAPVKTDRPFKMEMSDDGQNWNPMPGEVEVSGAILRFDSTDDKPVARFVRLLREGDKYESSMVGFYVYGKELRIRKR